MSKPTALMRKNQAAQYAENEQYLLKMGFHPLRTDLKDMRIKMRYSRAELARMVGISANTLQRLEEGRDKDWRCTEMVWLYQFLFRDSILELEQTIENAKYVEEQRIMELMRKYDPLKFSDNTRDRRKLDADTRRQLDEDANKKYLQQNSIYPLKAENLTKVLTSIYDDEIQDIVKYYVYADTSEIIDALVVEGSAILQKASIKSPSIIEELI